MKEARSELMNLREVLASLNISRSTFYRVARHNKFPAPFTGLGLEKKKLWRRDDVQNFLDGTAENSCRKMQVRSKKQNGIEVL